MVLLSKRDVICSFMHLFTYFAWIEYRLGADTVRCTENLEMNPTDGILALRRLLFLWGAPQ